MRIKHTKEYYTEFYNFLVEKNIRIGTLLWYRNKIYMVLGEYETYTDFELRIARVDFFPITKESMQRNSRYVKYSDIKTAKVLRQIDYKVNKEKEQQYQKFLLNLKFIAEMEEGIYYNREDNRAMVIVHIENDLNKCLYYELLDVRDFNESEIIEYCKENSENLYLEHMNFSFLVPIYGYYEKGTKNKDLIAIGLKLMMLDRVI